MKAVSAIGVIIVAALSVVTIEGLYLLVTLENVQTLKRSFTEAGITGEINKVEFLKRSLHQALVYSFYQSQYDIIKLSGYTEFKPDTKLFNGIPYWRTYDSWIFQENYLENLKKTNLKIFDYYLNSLKDKTDVQIPNYDLSLEPKENEIKVLATGDDKLKLEKENLKISDNSNIIEVIKTKFYEIFELAKEKFITTDSVRNIVTSADSSMANVNGKNCKVIPIGDVCEDSINAEATLATTCPNADTQFKNLVESGISSLPEVRDSVRLEIAATKEIMVKHSGDCSSSTGTQSEDCCKNGEWACNDQYNTQTGECIKCLSIDPATGECNWGSGSWSFVCTEYSKKLKDIKCYYDYSASVRLLVNVFDSSEYPVYDYNEKSTDYRDLQLTFYVLSGNDDLISY